MNRIRNTSIKNKLILIMLVITTSAVISGLTLKLIMNINNHKAELENESILAANLLADFSVAPLMFKQSEGAKDILARLNIIPMVVYSQLLDNSGNVFAKCKVIDETIKIPQVPQNGILSKFEGGYLHIYRPVEFEGNRYGTIYLLVSTERLYQAIIRHIISSLLIGFVMVLIVFFIAKRLQKTISEPILQLATFTKEISDSKDYSGRITKRRDDEIGTLYNSFNDMLTQIELRDEELLKSELRYKNLFEDSPVPLWEEDFSEVKINLDKLKEKGIADFKNYFNENPEKVGEFAKLVKVIDINKAVIELHEAGSKENLLKGLETVFTEESLATFKDGLIALAKGEKTFESVGIVNTLKGNKKHLHIKWLILSGFENSLGRVYVSTTDITERKLAEKALNESEKRYRVLAENSTDTIWLMQLDGTFLYHSPAIMELRGYTPEEANTIPIEETMTPQSAEFVSNIFAREDKKPMKERWNNLRFELEMFRKDGSKIWTEVTANAVFDEDGQMVGLQGSTYEITKRKEAEKALRESENKYFTLVENAPDAIIIHSNGKIVFVNKESVKLFKAKNSEALIGTEVLSYVHPDYRDLVSKRVEKTLKHGKVLQEEAIKVLRPDDSIVDVEVKGIPITFDGKLSIQLIVRDITERTKVGEALKEKVNKLERINRVMVDRELKMVELKKEINFLLEKEGKSKKYRVSE